jgi:hypothetical protein
MFVACMLVHYFCLVEFKLIFEFNCLNPLGKNKNPFPFLFSWFSPAATVWRRSLVSTASFARHPPPFQLVSPSPLLGPLAGSPPMPLVLPSFARASPHSRSPSGLMAQHSPRCRSPPAVADRRVPCIITYLTPHSSQARTRSVSRTRAASWPWPRQEGSLRPI